MRCTKCGYISFDHLNSCSKCATSLIEVAAQLQGTAFKVETPFFLASVVSSAVAEGSTGGASMDMDLSMTDEEMQQLDASLEDDVSLDSDDVAGLDLSELSEMPNEAETDAVDDDEVLDLSDIMDEDDL